MLIDKRWMTSSHFDVILKELRQRRTISLRTTLKFAEAMLSFQNSQCRRRELDWSILTLFKQESKVTQTNWDMLWQMPMLKEEIKDKAPLTVDLD